MWPATCRRGSFRARIAGRRPVRHGTVRSTTCGRSVICAIRRRAMIGAARVRTVISSGRARMVGCACGVAAPRLGWRRRRLRWGRCRSRGRLLRVTGARDAYTSYNDRDYSQVSSALSYVSQCSVHSNLPFSFPPAKYAASTCRPDY